MPKTTGWRNASQLAGTTAAKICKRLFGELVEPARLGILADFLIEARRLEFLEPGAESGELIGGQLGAAFSMSSRLVMVP